MEVKWLAIAMAVIFGLGFVGMSFEKHSESKCRIEAIKAGIEADKVKTACGVK